MEPFFGPMEFPPIECLLYSQNLAFLKSIRSTLLKYGYFAYLKSFLDTVKQGYQMDGFMPNRACFFVTVWALAVGRVCGFWGAGFRILTFLKDCESKMIRIRL